LPELLEELFEELDDELPEELEPPAPEPELELPELLDPPEEVLVEWDDELFVDAADECVEPGSVAATAPVTATLAKPTATVVAFSR
jgi:hypothetical protein